MSEAKFTPGPWEISPKDQMRVNVKMNSFLHPYEPKIATAEDLERFGDDCHDDWNICQCDDEYFMRNPKECEANARLICSAPDLYSACKRARSLLIEVRKFLPSLHALHARNVLETIDAALAKAKGE